MSSTETPSEKPSEGSPARALSETALAIENIVKCYGDLLFDLCESALWSPMSAQFAFRSILSEAKKRHPSEPYGDYERAWILNIACEKLRSLADSHGRKLTPSEQIELDSFQGAPFRLKKFESYFHRLAIEDQILLLLKDKYGIPFHEIAAAMGAPEGSLKMRRQQALRTLEDWLWA